MTADKEKTKMKIFISYGRENSEITKIIDAYLREKGYEVWYDVTSIRGTDDWREDIIEGLYDSQTVIANISEDFLKKDGVCSEEIGIALALKSNRIFTIYLEKRENLNHVPPTLTRTDYIDLSDWKEYIGDKEKFDKWFKVEFQPIIDRIEEKENVKFAGEITTIRQALKIPEIGSNKANSYLIKKYTKRPWIDAKIDGWRDDPKGKKIGVIYGKQGTGKSNYAARRCHTDYRIVANFFCEYNKKNFSSNKSLIRDLSFQLACQIGEFRFALIKQLKSISEVRKKINDMGFEEIVDDGKIYISEDFSEDEEFDNLIIKPLSLSIDGKIETKLILIDALDEAGKEDRARLINIIFNHLDRLPRWIRILVLTRPEADIKPYLQDAFEIDLDKEKNKADIKKFLETTFEDHPYPNKEEIIEKIVEKSDGTFLYAELVAKEILAGSLDIASIDTLPKGLASYYATWFQRIYPIERIDTIYKDKERKAIAMIIASPIALPSEELNNLLGWDYSQTNDFIKKLENYLTINKDVEGKETIEFAHKYMVDWLLSDLSGDYRVFKEDGIAYIYKGIEEVYLMDKKLDSMTRYEKLYLIDALRNQRGQKNLEDFLINNYAKNSLLYLADREAENYREEEVSKLYEDMIEIHKDGRGNISYYLAAANYYGLFLKNIGKADKGIKIIEELIEEQESLLSRKGDIFCKQGLSYSYHYLGLIYISKKKYDEAEIYFKKSIEELEDLIKERKSVEITSSLAFHYLGLADVCSLMTRHAEAETYIKKSISLQEELKNEMDPSEYMRGLSYAYSSLGDLYITMGRYDEAEIYYKQDVELRKSLNKEENSIESNEKLAIGYANMGGLYKDADRYDEAEIYYKDAIEIFEDVNREIDSLEDRIYLARLYGSLGIVYHLKNLYDQAEKFCLLALSIFESFKGPIVPYFDLTSLLEIYKCLGIIYDLMKRHEEEEIYIRKAIKLLENSYIDHPYINDKDELAQLYGQLAYLYLKKEVFDEAEKYCIKGIELGEDLYKTKSPSFNNKDMVYLLFSLATIQYKTNRKNQSRNSMLKAIKYQKILVKKEKNRENLYTLANIYLTVGSLGLMNEGKEAEKYFLEGKNILEKLYKKSPDAEVVNLLTRVYQALVEYYKSIGKHKNANAYTKKLGQLTDPKTKIPEGFNILQINKLDDFI